MGVKAKAEPAADPASDSAVDPNMNGHSVDADRLSRLYSSCDDFETRIQVAMENGLFEHQNKVTSEDVLGPLAEVMAISLTTEVSPQAYGSAIAKLDGAKGRFAGALVAVGTWKRLLYVYGLPPLVYLLLVLSFDGWVVLRLIPNYPGISFLSMPFVILVAGSVGSVLRGLVGLWWHVDRLEYRKVWSTWYLLNPFVGALLGGIVYLAFEVGIVVTTSSTTSMSNATLPILIAATAGYNWEWSRDLLNKVVQIFSTTATSTSSKSGSSRTTPPTLGKGNQSSPQNKQ